MRRNWALFREDARAEREVLRLADFALEPEGTAAILRRRLPPRVDLDGVWFRPPALPADFGAFLDTLEAAGHRVDDADRLRASLVPARPACAG